MAKNVNPHPAEETIEKYSTGALSERVRAGIEEHLLICEQCRQSVVASDGYVTAMRVAASKVRRAERKPKVAVKGARKA